MAPGKQRRQRLPWYVWWPNLTSSGFGGVFAGFALTLSAILQILRRPAPMWGPNLLLAGGILWLAAGATSVVWHYKRDAGATRGGATGDAQLLRSSRLDRWSFTTNYAFSVAGTIFFKLVALNLAVLLLLGLERQHFVDGWGELVGLVLCSAWGMKFAVNTAWLRRQRAMRSDSDTGE